MGYLPLTCSHRLNDKFNWLVERQSMSIDFMIYRACHDELRAVGPDSTSLTHQVGALTPGMPGTHVCCMMCRKAHDCLYGIPGSTCFSRYGVANRATLM